MRKKVTSNGKKTWKLTNYDKTIQNAHVKRFGQRHTIFFRRNLIRNQFKTKQEEKSMHHRHNLLVSFDFVEIEFVCFIWETQHHHTMSKLMNFIDVNLMNKWLMPFMLRFSSQKLVFTHQIWYNIHLKPTNFFPILKKRTIHEITGQLKSSKLITQILILNAQQRDYFVFWKYDEFK